MFTIFSPHHTYPMRSRYEHFDGAVKALLPSTWPPSAENFIYAVCFFPAQTRRVQPHRSTGTEPSSPSTVHIQNEKSAPRTCLCWRLSRRQRKLFKRRGEAEDLGGEVMLGMLKAPQAHLPMPHLQSVVSGTGSSAATGCRNFCIRSRIDSSPTALTRNVLCLIVEARFILTSLMFNFVFVFHLRKTHQSLNNTVW